METHKKAQVIPLNWQKEGHILLPPESAAEFFHNGKGVALGTLLNNLRAGKLNDIAFKDAFGWWVNVPVRLIEMKNNPLKAA